MIQDRVLFILPKSRELQFPAMSVIQTYLHNYEQRYAQPGGKVIDAQFELMYRVKIAPEDWAFFSQITLPLKYKPRMINQPDMIVDLSESRSEMFDDPKSRRHMAEIYGIISGVACRSIPIVKQIKASVDRLGWVILDKAIDIAYCRHITSEQLIDLADYQVGGVIGRQSWGTYLSAARGLPTIEILPADRNKNRLSKWDNSLYRMVEESHGGVEHQINQALDSILETQHQRRLDEIEKEELVEA